MSDSPIPTPPPVKEKKKAVRQRKQPKSLPPYNVVLLDDNDHTHEYVMEMLKSVFGYDTPRGFILADEVDSHGRAIVFTTHKEFAELKRDQIQGFGGDWRVATCQGSMSAKIERAEA